jgi:hypothetical protein
MSGIRLQGQIRRFKRSTIPLVRGDSFPDCEFRSDRQSRASSCQVGIAGLIPKREDGSPDNGKDRSQLKAKVVATIG